jgi:hypothetical protein
MIGLNPPRAFLAACALLLFTTTSAIAQDRDTLEVQRYVLTEANFAKFRLATKNLTPLAGSIPENCDDDNAVSLDAMAQKLNAVPALKAAIQSAGMTPREYVVFSWSLFHNGLAAWAVSQPGGALPSGISRANVDFYKKHEAELQKIGAPLTGSGCDDESDNQR